MLCHCLRKSEEQNSSTWSEPGRWSRANVRGETFRMYGKLSKKFYTINLAVSVQFPGVK
jgi:hypothetical protein